MRFFFALTAATVFACPVAAAPQHAPTVVHFAADSDELDAAGRARLDGTAERYRRAGSQQVIMTGHADPHEGSPAYTIGLSQRRANTVREYLASQGVPTGAMITQAFGRSSPMIASTRPDGANRRVEVTFAPASGW